MRAVLLAGLVVVSNLGALSLQAQEFEEERFNLCRNLEYNLAQIMGPVSSRLANLWQDRKNVLFERHTDLNDKDLIGMIGVPTSIEYLRKSTKERLDEVYGYARVWGALDCKDK